jgi:hypothetical protein
MTSTGSVNFYMGTALLGTMSLNAGTASLTTTTLPVGSDSITAIFQGSSEFATSTSASLDITVNSPSNPTSVIAGMLPAFTLIGNSTFTLTITGSGFTSGSTVYWGNTGLATQYTSATQLTAQVPSANVVIGGITAITVQTPAPGRGTSNAMQFEVDTAASGVTAPVFNPSSATIAGGATASYAVTLPTTATNVSASCLNLPAGATCSYSATARTVAISTSSTTPVGAYQITVTFTETLPGEAAAFGWLPIILLPAGLIKRRMTARRLWLTTCLALALLASAAFATGCGAGSGQTGPSNPQTQVVTSSGVVTLTVQ